MSLSPHSLCATSPTPQDALATWGRWEYLRAPVLRERLCLALKTLVLCIRARWGPPALGPAAGQADTQSWVLSGMGGLLSPHRQSKALGSRVVGKPAGPSSATPHEPAQDVLALLGCCQTGTRTEGWQWVPKPAEDGGTQADGGFQEEREPQVWPQ